MLTWVSDLFTTRAFADKFKELDEQEPLFCSGHGFGESIRFRLSTVGAEGGKSSLWLRCLVMVDADGLRLYRNTHAMAVHFHIHPADLRWFGRPEKYVEGFNIIWIHVEMDNRWYVLELRMWRHNMQALVRALKQIATEEQITAYRRRRPYIHFGPAKAHIATQDLHGAWTLAAQPITLHLGPSALVILQGGHVQRVLMLEQMQNIEVMRRLDDAAGGVVRFRFTDSSATETLAFSLTDYIQFGAELGEAAKRTLEDPPVFYSKKKGEELDDDWED